MRYSFETWVRLVLFHIFIAQFSIILIRVDASTSHNAIFQQQHPQKSTRKIAKLRQFSSILDNQRQTLINTVTKNISNIISNYNQTNAVQIPEKLWQLEETSSTEDYKTQVTKQVTPDDITTLQQQLDNLDEYQQIKLKNKQQSPIIGITDIDSFNAFITDITKKAIIQRESITKNRDSGPQVTLTLPTTDFNLTTDIETEAPNTTNEENLTDSSTEQIRQQNVTTPTTILPTSINTSTFTDINDNDKTLMTEINQMKGTTATTTTIDDAQLIKPTRLRGQQQENSNYNDDENNDDGHIEQILWYYMSSAFNTTTTSTTNTTNDNETTSFNDEDKMELPSPINLFNKTSSSVNATMNKNENNNKWDKVGKNGTVTSIISRDIESFQLKEIQEAVDYGFEQMNDLYLKKEPKLYQMGLWLEEDHPAHYVAAFNSQRDRARDLAKYGFVSLQATNRLISQIKNPESRATTASAFSELTPSLRQTTFHDLCPLRGPVRCPQASRRYRTADGTCNNGREPRRGSAFMPMARFLSAHYDDGVETVRRSVIRNRPLPSAREISTRIHEDQNVELAAVTHMLMAWGQFIDHDIIQSAQSRGFNGSVPRCCANGGLDFQPFENMHPDCLPIEVPSFDWFFGRFGIRCMEFVRSSPASRVDCSLGWREQINQVTAYIDASNLYGSSVRQAELIRTFRDGQLAYARTNFQSSTDEAERCHRGANSANCFQTGDNRVSEQPGLTSMHIVWIRQHNLIASILARENRHWSDEKIYQETRRIIGAMIQHITYREFLPIVLGPEVIESFELKLLKKGYYHKYDPAVNPGPANSFAAAAFRFGHSLVQHSFMRCDKQHRFFTDNVTFHNEPDNVDNIWSFGSADRVLLGMCNQPSQKRDVFISDELTNHLFQTPRFLFGMDLASINIQRGRDHGIPPYTTWRSPCGLSAVRSWSDLDRIMSPDTVAKLQSLYLHFDDIDLFTGGLAEKPVRGGLVGPTFACIIAQQFANLRQGDRFWYENGDSESSFTPPQLQQLRKITLSQVLCSSMKDFDTIQPFVFLTSDNFRNERISCDDPILNNFDLGPWIERKTNDHNVDIDETTDIPEEITTQLSPFNRLKTSLLNDNTEIKSETNKTNTSLTDVDDTIMLNQTLVKRTSLFPGELFALEMKLLKDVNDLI